MRLPTSSPVLFSRVFPASPAPLWGIVVLALLLVAAAPRGAWGQTAIFEEPFDDDSEFTVTQGTLTQDGDDNYFILAQNANPRINKSYTGSGTNFLAGQDLNDAEVNSDPAQVEWTGINISGESGLEFTGEFGETLRSRIFFV